MPTPQAPMQPSGPLEVGAQDVSFHKEGEKCNADNHVVGRLFYPTTSKGPWLRPRWLPAFHYAWGNVLFVMWFAKTLAQRMLRYVLATVVWLTGMSVPVDVHFNTPLDKQHGPYPVIIYSHGAASMRNTFSTLCCELASRGFVVLALEHADGSACSVEMADGSIMEFKGLGVGPMLEAKVVYRTAECRTALKLLKALHEGTSTEGTVRLSGRVSANEAFKGSLDLSKVALVGHSCGGGTVIESVARHSDFNCGVAFDPWYPFLVSNGPALTDFATSTPLLVMGSHTWNTPDPEHGHLPCNGDNPANVNRQQLVLKAARRRSAGGCIHFVPKGTNHHSFSDLPAVGTTPVARAIGKLVGHLCMQMNIKTTDMQPAAMMALLGSAVQTFLDAHMPLGPEDAPARVAKAFAQVEHEQKHQLQQKAAHEEKPQGPARARVSLDIACTTNGAAEQAKADPAEHQEFAVLFKGRFESHAASLTV